MHCVGISNANKYMCYVHVHIHMHVVCVCAYKKVYTKQYMYLCANVYGQQWHMKSCIYANGIYMHCVGI